jgi:SulP family sulfate permease
MEPDPLYGTWSERICCSACSLLHAYRADTATRGAVVRQLSRADLLAGLVVALALIPEAIAFSIIAGVDPKVGLYASFSIAVITAITGGRPGMISAATAATAVLMVTLVRDHGLQYLLAATVLAGLIQIAAGRAEAGLRHALRVKSVMTGFVNALAILIFMAQLPELDPATSPG